MTTINVELDGLQQLLAQLKALGDDAEQVTIDTMNLIAVLTQGIAKKGISRGPKSGKVYRRGPGRNLSATHQASAPGQYPASDTGQLAKFVLVDKATPGNMTAIVGTNVQYGPMLEFGTSRMAARPWLLPSFTQAKINVEKKLRANLEARI